MVTYDQFAGRCEAVLGRIRQACVAAGRAPDSVRLLPVTKTHPVDAALFTYTPPEKTPAEDQTEAVIKAIKASLQPAASPGAATSEAPPAAPKAP